MHQRSNKRKKGFLIFYAVLVAALAALSLYSVNYVKTVLPEYEKAQPDKMAADCAERIQQAAKEGRLDQVVSFAEAKKEASFTEEEFERYQREIAESTLTVKKYAGKDNGKEEENVTCYNILCDNAFTVAKYKIKSVGQKTMLGIFTVDLWEEQSLDAALFTTEMTLPYSVKVSLNGAEAQGTLSEDKKTVSYQLHSISKPEIILTDILGNSVKYQENGEYSFKEYKLTVPSSFTVMGKEAVPLSEVESAPISDYENIYPYFPDMPVMVSADLYIMENGDYPLTVLDNLGNKVDISQMGDVITLTQQSGTDTMPENITAFDPLEAAKLWSLFMTDDIETGAYLHGFNTMAQYLFKGTAQYERAYEWATGMDITFTSNHYLAEQPFAAAEIGNFVSYGDGIFSCEIYLQKPLYITTGTVVDDALHGTFYFAYMDDSDGGNPHWGILDIIGIA